MCLIWLFYIWILILFKIVRGFSFKSWGDQETLEDKMPKGFLDAVNGRMTGYTVTIWKENPIMFYNTLHRMLQIEQHELNKNRMWQYLYGMQYSRSVIHPWYDIYLCLKHFSSFWVIFVVLMYLDYTYRTSVLKLQMFNS